MWLAFAICPLLIFAPAVIIAAPIVFTVPALIIIVFGGTCFVLAEGLRLVLRSARKLRHAQKSHRQEPQADAELASAGPR
jgi:hypothetical protein